MDGETPREQLVSSNAQSLFLKRLHIKVSWQINSMEPGKGWVASQRGCSPSTEQEEGASGKDAPTILSCFTMHFPGKYRKKVCVHCLLWVTCLHAWALCQQRIPTFLYWWRQQHTVVGNLVSECLGSKLGSTTTCWPGTSCQSPCFSFSSELKWGQWH